MLIIELPAGVVWPVSARSGADVFIPIIFQVPLIVTPWGSDIVFGARKYINRTVKVYSQLNDESTLSNCLQIIFLFGIIVNFLAFSSMMGIMGQYKKIHKKFWRTVRYELENRCLPCQHAATTATFFLLRRYFLNPQ